MLKNFNLKSIDALIQKGAYEEAHAAAAAASLPADVVVAIHATIALKQERFEEAENLFAKALRVNPNNAIAVSNLAHLLIAQKKLNRALPYAEKAFRANPANENLALNYVACLCDRDRFSDAEAVIRPFKDKDGASVKVWLAYASVLRALIRPRDAMDVLEEAKTFFPEHPDVQQSIADAYAELDPLEARKAFSAILATTTKSKISLEWNWSFVELRLRNFELGWKLYENGLHEKVGKVGRPLPHQIKTFRIITDLEALDREKYTIFTVEQGLGDQVLFLGCLDQALARFPKAIIVCEDRMLNVLKRSFPMVESFDYGFAVCLSQNDQIFNGAFPIGSLQKHFRSDIESFRVNRKSYLQPDQILVEKFRTELVRSAPGKRLIGISWSGGFWDRQKKTKSFPLRDFEPIFSEHPDCRFVALQYGDISEERKLSQEHGWPITFIDGIDFKKDIDSWFALMCACDKIVSVSTALVHFSGAAGKEVELLLSSAQGPFIWGLEAGPSLPYSHVYVNRKRPKETVKAFFKRVSARV